MQPPARTCPRGAAMAETVLILPVVLVLLLMVLYYGIAVTRLQRAAVQDRYEAWRQVYHGYGPRAAGLDMLVHPPWTGTDQINATFWDNSADRMTHNRSDRFPDDTRTRMIDDARRRSTGAGNYARELLHRHLPHGRTVNFTTTHRQRSAYLQSDTFTSPIRHGHTRIGAEWKYIDGQLQRDDDQWIHAQPMNRHNPPGRLGPIHHGDAVRDIFLEELDNAMIQARPSRIASVVRRYYRQFPAYRGPDVDRQFDTN